ARRGVAVIAPVHTPLSPARVASAPTAPRRGPAHAAPDSIGGAAAVATHLPAGAGDALIAAAHGAFTDAMGQALLIGTGVMLIAAVIVKRFLPDLRSSTTAAPGVPAGEGAAERPGVHSAPALEAPGSPS